MQIVQKSTPSPVGLIPVPRRDKRGGKFATDAARWTRLTQLSTLPKVPGGPAGVAA